MVLDGLEAVVARLPDLRAHVLGDVELGVHLRVAAAPLVVAVARPVAVVLAHDEERRLDEEAEVAVLERAAVALTDEEADQAGVAVGHLVRLLVEGDARAIDDREVGGERRVEREEALVEDGDRRLGQLRVLYYWGHGHQCRASVGRNVGLVVPVLAARVLP